MSAEKELIPKLDLESFVFTPPGPMGWAFEITEEEEEHVKQGLQNIIAAEETLSVDSLVELSSHRQIVHTNATVEDRVEVVPAEEKQEVSEEIDPEIIDEAVKQKRKEETKHKLAKVKHEEKQEVSKKIDPEIIDKAVEEKRKEETKHKLEEVKYEEKQEVSKKIDPEIIDKAVEEKRKEETKHKLAKAKHEEIKEVEETEEGNNDGIIEVVIENKVTIILPKGPLKAPWLLNNQLKKFKI